MTSPGTDWKRLLELLEPYLALNETERDASLERLAGLDPELKSSLRQLLAQRDGRFGNRRAAPIYASAPDDDATILPGASSGIGHKPAEIVSTAGVWAAPPAGQTPEADSSLSTIIRPRANAPVSEVGHEDSSAESERALGKGDVLDGRYTLMTELGRGGMGTVYKALDRNRQEFGDRQLYIALKLLSEEFKRHPDARIALQRETVRAQSLTHENIVRVHDFDYDGTYAYMTMELLDGQTLEDWLREESSSQASLERRWAIVRGVGAGLSCAHKHGVVHSDLKPGNVFLCKDGGVKVMDFGIARPLRAAAGEVDTTRFDAAERLGALTPAYASLEQLNQEPPDPRDDIYAFACVVYYLFSGRHPFGRESAKRAFETHLAPQRIPALTRKQWDVLRRGLAFKRTDRIASVDAFLRQFAPLTWWHKNRLSLLSATAVLSAVGLFFGWQYYSDYMEDQAVNAQLWPDPAPRQQPLTAEERHDIDDFLYLSREALRQAAGAKSPEDLSAILSKGDNNLLDLLKRVRELDPANAQVLQMTNDATRLYAQKARTLLATHQPEDALRLLREGQTFRHTHELFQLRRTICGSNAALCSELAPKS